MESERQNQFLAGTISFYANAVKKGMNLHLKKNKKKPSFVGKQ